MKQQDKQPNTKLKHEQELRSWSQQKIADAIGTSDQVVNRWENGQHRPNRHFQTQLCELFDKSAVELGFMNMPESIQEKIETRFEYVEKNLLATETETLSSVDLFYYQAEASLTLGDLEKSCAYIQVAVESAKNENSRLYYNKVLATYQEMRKTWQHESLVNNLEALFQPW